MCLKLDWKWVTGLLVQQPVVFKTPLRCSHQSVLVLGGLFTKAHQLADQEQTDPDDSGQHTGTCKRVKGSGPDPFDKDPQKRKPYHAGLFVR